MDKQQNSRVRCTGDSQTSSLVQVISLQLLTLCEATQKRCSLGMQRLQSDFQLVLRTRTLCERACPNVMLMLSSAVVRAGRRLRAAAAGMGATFHNARSCGSADEALAALDSVFSVLSTAAPAAKQGQSVAPNAARLSWQNLNSPRLRSRQPVSQSTSCSLRQPQVKCWRTHTETDRRAAANALRAMAKSVSTTAFVGVDASLIIPNTTLQRCNAIYSQCMPPRRKRCSVVARRNKVMPNELKS